MGQPPPRGVGLFVDLQPHFRKCLFHQETCCVVRAALNADSLAMYSSQGKMANEALESSSTNGLSAGAFNCTWGNYIMSHEPFPICSSFTASQQDPTSYQTLWILCTAERPTASRRGSREAIFAGLTDVVWTAVEGGGIRPWIAITVPFTSA